MTKQFRVGDKVRVIKEFCEHKVGKVVVIRIVDDNDPDYTYGLEGGGWIDGDSIEIVKEDASMTKYKTVKRKANVGERILITKASSTFGDYKNGDVLTVTGFYKDAVREAVRTKPWIVSINHDEYRVIVDEPKRKKPKRIDELEARVTELEAKVAELTKVTPKQPWKSTPNQQRKATIERAKVFVEESKKKPSFDGPKGYLPPKEKGSFTGYWCDVEFVVNSDKRTVVALLKWRYNGEIKAKGIAKCAPDDVFNADIGKAIALGRALSLDVSEFENAVKPTEVVVGMRLIYASNKDRGVITVISDDNGGNYPAYETKLCVAKIISADIIDDTEAQY